jgi:UPF0716 protein FxsA
MPGARWRAKARDCRYEQGMGKLALLFTALPLAELFVLFKLGDLIGGWRTVLIVLASAIVGAFIARAEGLRVLAHWREALGTGVMPSEGVLRGMLILFACALLITPGVLTDVLAIALLIPWSRQLIAKRVTARVERAMAQGSLRVVQAQARAVAPRKSAERPGPPRVIDVEGETVEQNGAPEGAGRRLNS